MIERCPIVVVRNCKGMMHAAMVVRHRIDRRIALDQDEASAGRVEERHLSVRRGRQTPAPDHLRIELRALRSIAHRYAEMSYSRDRNHLTLLPLPLDHPSVPPAGSSITAR